MSRISNSLHATLRIARPHERLAAMPDVLQGELDRFAARSRARLADHSPLRARDLDHVPDAELVREYLVVGHGRA
jgi:hypothetical protein